MSQALLHLLLIPWWDYLFAAIVRKLDILSKEKKEERKKETFCILKHL